jgi:methyl-accepting chemotaxis protein
VGEQNKALTELSKEGDEVRRIARQSARSLAEQSQVVTMLSSSTQRHTSGLERVVQSVAEQATGSQQLGQVVTDIRARSRELSSAISKRGDGQDERELVALASELQALRQAYLAHADSLAELHAQLSAPQAAQHPGAAVPSAAVPSAAAPSAAAPSAAVRPAERA